MLYNLKGKIDNEMCKKNRYWAYKKLSLLIGTNANTCMFTFFYDKKGNEILNLK